MAGHMDQQYNTGSKRYGSRTKLGFFPNYENNESKYKV